MKITSVKYLNAIVEWLKKTWEKIGKSCSDKWKLMRKWFVGKWEKVREWIRINRVSLLWVIPIMAILYLMPLTFMLADKERAIVGIVLQILAGVILVFDQIASNENVKEQLNKLIQNSTIFSLLITIVLLLFALSVLMGVSDDINNKWSTAAGIMVFIPITWGMFLSSLTFLKRIKWLRRKDYVPTTMDKFEVSDLSIRNVAILFVASLLFAFIVGYVLNRFASNNQFWIQSILFFVVTFYAFTFFPLLVISPLYFLGFISAKITVYLTKRNLNIWFWIFLFVIWAWGGLLLLINEF